MVIEWLKFRVDPNRREEFVQFDTEIWTAALATYPGFLRKEIWISPSNLDEVVTVIHWETAEQWHSIPAAELEQIEAEFNRALDGSYELLESSMYQVRKLFQP